MEIVDTTQLDWELVVPNTRGGDVYRKVVRAAEGGRQVSYDIRFERFGVGDKGYSSIRHRHDFEQLRFAASGRMDLGFDTLEEGDVGYFPANAYYGPQRCEGAEILVAQWGDRFITKSESDQAVAELSKHGEFRDGIYHGAGADGRPFNKDPLNAIWEHVFGERYVPQQPRYRQPVLITPSAFGWSQSEGAVKRRRLGLFTENDLEIESVEWNADGSFEVDVAPQDRRPIFLWTTRGTFGYDGQNFGALTGVWAAPGEGIKLEGARGSAVLLVRFPEPSSRITVRPSEAK